jgi:hypothetical protein
VWNGFPDTERGIREWDRAQAAALIEHAVRRSSLVGVAPERLAPRRERCAVKREALDAHLITLDLVDVPRGSERKVAHVPELVVGVAVDAPLPNDDARYGVFGDLGSGRDPDMLACVDRESHGFGRRRPLVQVSAVGGEDLHAVVAVVADVDVT